MLAKTKSFSFIDKLTLELEETAQGLLQVVLKSEDGKICCKTEKNIHAGKSSVRWEGLNDLPYGIYTLQCCQGEEMIELRMVKRV